MGDVHERSGGYYSCDLRSGATKSWAWVDDEGNRHVALSNGDQPARLSDFRKFLRSHYDGNVLVAADPWVRQAIRARHWAHVGTTRGWDDESGCYRTARTLANWAAWERLLDEHQARTTPLEVEGPVRIATDGSLNHVTGWGSWCWVGPNGYVGAGVAQGYDVNYLELAALFDALTHLPQGCDAHLVSDSRTAVKVAQGNLVLRRATDAATRELAEATRALVRAHGARVSWVKGHAQHKQNLRVDLLARELRATHEKVVADDTVMVGSTGTKELV